MVEVHFTENLQRHVRCPSAKVSGATVRQVLYMTLEGAGYEVLQAVDGVDALAKLANEQSTCL